ncbi:MAG: hypothetical protein HYY57_03585, partial [Candidatus Omnitrophica bacterium]|nr:hypothetical protein [Candidatus Omnitrophota bacterium]
MRWKTTLILFISVIGLGAYISLHEIKQPLPQEKEQLAKQVLSIAPESVTQIALDLPQAKITLTRNQGV